MQAIKILARYGNGANFIEIDEVESTPGQETVFDFYNDRISSGVSPQTTDKTFDNVPQKAQAQSVASNRLVYKETTSRGMTMLIAQELNSRLFTPRDLPRLSTMSLRLNRLLKGAAEVV